MGQGLSFTNHIKWTVAVGDARGTKAARWYMSDDDVADVSTVTTEGFSLDKQDSRLGKVSDGDKIAAIRTASRFFDGHEDSTNHQLGGHATKLGHKSCSANQTFSPPALDIVFRSRTPSKPVKCPPPSTSQRRGPSAPSFGGGGGSHGNDEDVQYLRRLYEIRTWDMYLRITEARKQQRFNPSADRNYTAATGAPDIPSRHESDIRTADASPPCHEMMVFSCDLD